MISYSEFFRTFDIGSSVFGAAIMLVLIISILFIFKKFKKKKPPTKPMFTGLKQEIRVGYAGLRTAAETMWKLYDLFQEIEENAKR